MAVTRSLRRGVTCPGFAGRDLPGHIHMTIIRETASCCSELALEHQIRRMRPCDNPGSKGDAGVVLES
jgi:hypothetical protein